MNQMFVVLSFALICMSGCISVSLPTKNSVQRAHVKVEAPQAPFEVFAANNSDQAWRNPRNGNSISYFSNCQDISDPSLEVIRRDMLADIEETHISNSQNLTYNGRQALRSIATGKVDGVAAKMDLLVLKKNGCIYGLSYVGLLSSYDADHAAFERFIKDFEAP